MWQTDAFETYETERFQLRRITIADVEPIFRNLSDPVLMKFYDMPALQTLDDASDLLARWRGAEISGTGCRWGIVQQDSGELIGTIGLHAINTVHGRCEVGYEINRRFWGRGIMSEIFPSVLRHAFERLALQRIGALVVPSNLASVALLRKFGFQDEGLLRNYMKVDGTSTDMASFSLLTCDILPATCTGTDRISMTL